MSVNPCSWWRGDIRESVMPGEMHKVMIQDMGTLFAYLNIRFQNKICERDNALKYCLLYLRLLIFLYILHKFWWFFSMEILQSWKGLEIELVHSKHMKPLLWIYARQGAEISFTSLYDEPVQRHRLLFSGFYFRINSLLFSLCHNFIHFPALLPDLCPHRSACLCICLWIYEYITMLFEKTADKKHMKWRYCKRRRGKVRRKKWMREWAEK